VKEMIKTNENWKGSLYKKSILKQLKYKMIRKYLGNYQQLRCLDLGSDNGVISYLLRQGGGHWHSADIDKCTVEMIRDMVTENVYLLEDEKLPFENEFFDIVVIVDLLEHIDQDLNLMLEIFRVLKPGGILIVNVHYLRRFSFTRWIRAIAGLTDKQHGHVRKGYTIDSLRQLATKLTWQRGETYSREFTELIDIIVSFVVTLLNSKPVTQKGIIIGQEDITKHNKLFNIYSVLYPGMWLFSKLDLFLFFLPGHKLIARFKKAKSLEY
jgi:SAM-dependent methyltransferase